jgi:hypothetical protein
VERASACTIYRPTARISGKPGSNKVPSPFVFSPLAWRGEETGGINCNRLDANCASYGCQKSQLDHRRAFRYCQGMSVNALTIEVEGLVVVCGHAGGTCRA